MLVIVYIILIYINKSQGDCPTDSRSHENIVELELHKVLQCNYNVFESPKPNGTVYIYLKFMMKSYNFNSVEEYFSVNSMVYMSWNDERLKWNASDYDNINSTVVMSNTFWLPGLRLINIAYGDDYDIFFFNPCQLMSNGKVMCILRRKYEARCNTILTHWPYDVQNCSLEFGSWARAGTKVVFKFSETPFIYSSEYGDQWNVIDYAQISDPTSEIQLKLTLTLQRQAMSLAAIIVYPSLILAILNISSMVLDIRDNMRLGLLCFSLGCHFLFMSELHLDIPKHSVDSPIIIMYYRGSLIITLTLILLTYILGVMCNRVVSSLSVSLINDTVLGGPLRYFIWPRWDSTVSKYTEEWTKFTNIVNSFCVIVMVAVYIGLFLAYMPRQVSV